jgi:hypothetical protein
MKEKEKIEKIINAIKVKNDGSIFDFAAPGYAAKQVTTYQSMRSDLVLCRNCISELFDNKNNDIVKSSLFYTIIALYGKCFTDATSSKSAKLELSDFKEKKELIPYHNEIMDMRHNFVAHRGSSEHEFGVAYLSLGVSDLSRQVRVTQIKRKSFDKEKIGKYIELLDFLICIVEDKYKKGGEKLWNHMLNEYTPNQFAMFKIAGPEEDKTTK